MHGRLTEFKASDIAAIEARLDDLGKESAGFPGQVRSQVVWNEDGTGYVLAIYETEAAAQAAAAMAMELWGTIMPYLEGPPETSEFSKAHVMK